MPGRFPPLECQNNLNHQSLIKRLEVHDKNCPSWNCPSWNSSYSSSLSIYSPENVTFWPIGQENHLPNLQFLGLNMSIFQGFQVLTSSRYFSITYSIHPLVRSMDEWRWRSMFHFLWLWQAETASWTEGFLINFMKPFLDSLLGPPIKISSSWSRKKAGRSMIRAYYENGFP